MALDRPVQEVVHGGGHILDGVELPTAYRINAEKALAKYPRQAANYLKHTLVGDPLLDGMPQELADMPRSEVTRFIQAGMDQDLDVMRSAPKVLRDFFVDSPPPDPPWLDYEAFKPGIRKFFQKDSGLIMSGFVAGVLVDGFGTLISKSFVHTGRVFEHGVRRLQQNNRHLVDVFFPGGLERQGDGWKLTVRIRLIHAQMRHLLNASEDWDREAWGGPLNAAHLGYAAACFSARTIVHSESVGVSFTQEEKESICAIWRYTAYIMGIPESITFTNYAEALEMHKVGNACEPPITEESIIMTNALINSAPLVAGVTDRAQRRIMVEREIYPISRALIGNDLADRLRFPKSKTIGILWQFRMLQRIRRWRVKLRGKSIVAENFGQMLAISAFDDAGISYYMPDHERAEMSSKW